MCGDILVDEDNTEMTFQENEATAAASLPAKKFRQKTPFIERIAQLELTDIDQVYRVLKQAGELKNATIAADKSVQNTGSKGGGDGQQQQQQQPDIPIVNVPECPERSDRPSATGSAGVSGSSATRVARGVRPPPVPMPILGVQLQQQELAQQRIGGGLGLPVPTQDISIKSSSFST
ncbi:hypothetical protein FF38_00620 [Lucilia cuprina]|uniref:Uncharacterized protein n=1 Tax=Lucilia cuprina TaxID=7375 RepID=A0A0L0BXR6_LUCCU|nr:hypothetical protein FF38_00620 [Lucilia cuprina]